MRPNRTKDSSESAQSSETFEEPPRHRPQAKAKLDMMERHHGHLNQSHARDVHSTPTSLRSSFASYETARVQLDDRAPSSHVQFETLSHAPFASTPSRASLPSARTRTIWRAEAPWDINPDTLDDEQVQVLGALLPVQSTSGDETIIEPTRTKLVPRAESTKSTNYLNFNRLGLQNETRSNAGGPKLDSLNRKQPVTFSVPPPFIPTPPLDISSLPKEESSSRRSTRALRSPNSLSSPRFKSSESIPSDSTRILSRHSRTKNDTPVPTALDTSQQSSLTPPRVLRHTRTVESLYSYSIGTLVPPPVPTTAPLTPLPKLPHTRKSDGI
ncbi:uncharacterized protein JCM15063_005421 [Sporobolomyces koalae]|uniref:uncharacterized protein n=1 Tax=Sporobolomyces koalae TaxID=500713 RepID=UPI00317C4928